MVASSYSDHNQNDDLHKDTPHIYFK